MLYQIKPKEVKKKFRDVFHLFHFIDQEYINQFRKLIVFKSINYLRPCDPSFSISFFCKEMVEKQIKPVLLVYNLILIICVVFYRQMTN